MAKNRSLNYISTFIVDHGGELESEYSWIEPIATTQEFAEEYGEYYKVRSTDVDGKWGIIDSDGKLVTELRYDHINSKAMLFQDYFLFWAERSGTVVLVTTGGQEYFGEPYRNPVRLSADAEDDVCLLYDGTCGKYCLGNCRTGKIITESKYIGRFETWHDYNIGRYDLDGNGCKVDILNRKGFVVQTFECDDIQRFGYLSWNYEFEAENAFIVYYHNALGARRVKVVAFKQGGSRERTYSIEYSFDFKAPLLALPAKKAAWLAKKHGWFDTTLSSDCNSIIKPSKRKFVC